LELILKKGFKSISFFYLCSGNGLEKRPTIGMTAEIGQQL
jgi:hypothetical protein